MAPVYPPGYAGGYTHKKLMLHRLFRGVYPRIKVKKWAKKSKIFGRVIFRKKKCQKLVMWASQEVVIGLFGSEKGPLTPRRSPRAPKNLKNIDFWRVRCPHHHDFSWGLGPPMPPWIYLMLQDCFLGFVNGRERTMGDNVDTLRTTSR